MDTKVCKTCQIEKPLSEFYLARQTHKGKTYEVRNSNCKSCHYEKTKHSARAHQLKTKYGISESEYAELLESQGGVCKICQTKGKEDKKLSVDHCHKTNRVRGLLCQNCNVGLGKFQDDKNLLLSAVEYLARVSI